MKKFFKLFLLTYFFITCSKQKEALPFYNSPDFTPIFEKPKKDSHTINSFVFTNQKNEDFGSKDLIGKIHIANFIFTSCTNICPVMTTNMTKVEGEFANDKDVELVSFTVTPWIDNPELLKRYKKGFTLNSNNWTFLTGDKNKNIQTCKRVLFCRRRNRFYQR